MLVTPHEYLAICVRQRTGRVARGERKGETFTYQEPDEVAATLLYLIERWALYKMKESGAKLKWSDTWVYMSVDQIQDYELCRAFGTSRVIKGFELLESLGFVSKRRNPDNPTDRTFQYRFELATVQAAVDNLPPFFNFEEWKLRNRKMQPLGSKNASFEIEETIPHDPTQSPTHDPAQKEQMIDAREAVEPEPPAQEVSSPPPPLEASDLPARSNVFRQYENNIEPITPMSSEELKALEKEYPEAWIFAAIAEAVARDKRRLGYIKAVLRGWESSGPPAKHKPQVGALSALFEPLCRTLGYSPDSLTPVRRSEVNTLAEQLLTAGATPEDMDAYKGYLEWRARQEEWSGFGLKAMSKYWADFVAARANGHKPAKHPPLNLEERMFKARLVGGLIAEGREDEANSIDYETLQRLMKEANHG